MAEPFRLTLLFPACHTGPGAKWVSRGALPSRATNKWVGDKQQNELRGFDKMREARKDDNSVQKWHYYSWCLWIGFLFVWAASTETIIFKQNLESPTHALQTHFFFPAQTHALSLLQRQLHELGEVCTLQSKLGMSSSESFYWKLTL